ncbi:MAG: septum formation initiator family protein [bacterium]
MENKKYLIVLAICLGFIVIALGNQHFRRMIIYRRNRKILITQVEELRKKNEQLSKKIEVFEKNPEKAYYKMAREDFGMIKEGEVKYHFIKKK